MPYHSRCCKYFQDYESIYVNLIINFKRAQEDIRESYSVEAVELINISKKFDDNIVIPDLSLSIEEGEFVVLVGPSGCGKSTTLRMIAGLEDVSSGHIEIAGRNVTNVVPKARDIAMVFQSYALYPHMDVAGNMSFSLRLAKFSKDEINQRVKEAAEMLGLTELLDRQPKELSGGQRQRVAMGRAIVRNAYCFLFDEPLSNLDAKLRAQMRTELKLLHQQLKRTMIYVTHDQIEAMTMADRIVVMDKGEIQQVGTPYDVYGYPVNTFVAGFIGSPAMNMLDGMIVKNGSGYIIEGDGYKLPVPGAFDPALHALDHRDVIAGMRPEHFSADQSGKETGKFASVQLEVAVSEYIGANQFLAARIGGSKVTASVESGAEHGLMESGTYFFETERLYLFDKKTGETLKPAN